MDHYPITVVDGVRLTNIYLVVTTAHACAMIVSVFPLLDLSSDLAPADRTDHQITERKRLPSEVRLVVILEGLLHCIEQLSAHNRFLPASKKSLLHR